MAVFCATPCCSSCVTYDVVAEAISETLNFADRDAGYVASRCDLRSSIATSRPFGLRKSSASVTDDRPIDCNAAMPAFDGFSISENVVRNRVAASSAGVALSVNVARAAATSLNDRPKACDVGKMPVPIARSTAERVVSPVPTSWFSCAAASAASFTPLMPDDRTPMTACVVLPRSALPIFASFDACSTMAIAFFAEIPVVTKADWTWYSDSARSSGLNPTFGLSFSSASPKGFSLF